MNQSAETAAPQAVAAPVSIAPGAYLDSRPLSAVIKATLFKMSGDYSDKVAVTINPQGVLTYFPAPSDINLNTKPKYIGEGWWLNRQGLSENSVFTKWTFEEYAALDKVPTPAEIKQSIIPGARVTDFCRLSILASEAETMTPPQLLSLIK